MEIIKTGLEGVVIIEPRLFKDTRHKMFADFESPFTEDIDLYPEINL